MSADTTPAGRTAMIVLLLIWGTAGFSARSGAEPAREIALSPHLLVNVSNTERYVVNGKCESEGIHELSQILRGSDFEEMWAFLPRAHGTQSCQWHEIGREERSERDSANMRVDRAYLEELMARNTEIHLYHVHPLRYFECAVHAGCRQDAAAGEVGSFDARWLTDLVFSMPSPSDVHFMMDVTSRFYRHQRRGTIKHKVVTPYGVVDYGLTDPGLAKFDSERHSRSEGLYIMRVAASALADDRVELLVKDQPGGIIAAVRKLAQTLNTAYLRVVHTTFASDAVADQRPRRGAN